MVAAVLAQLPELVNGRAPLVRRGRFFSGEFLVEADRLPVHVKVCEGRIEAVEAGPFRMRGWRFAIRADAAAWLRFWEPVPEPGYHDRIAMSRLRCARLAGPPHPQLPNLPH